MERIQNAIRERCESNKTSDVENAAIPLKTSHNIIVEHTHRRNHHVLVTNTTTAIPTVPNPPGQRHPPHPSCPLARVHNARINGIAVDYVLRARGRHGRGGGHDA